MKIENYREINYLDTVEGVMHALLGIGIVFSSFDYGSMKRIPFFQHWNEN